MKLMYFGLLMLILTNVICASPYDDGKYRPKKYNYYNDGKYYRPLNEGKYVRGNEGRYTYIYRQGLYPEDRGDYKYIHREGPGDHGDYRYIHQEGPGGLDGAGGHGDGYGPDGSGASGGPNVYYFSNKIYAERFKHFAFGDWIKNIVDKHIPSFYNAEQSETSYNRINPVINREKDTVNCTNFWNMEDFLNSEEDLLYSYKVQGEKRLHCNIKKSIKILKFVYQVFVKVYEDDDS